MEEKGPWLLIGVWGIVALVLFSQIVTSDSYAGTLCWAVMAAISLLAMYKIYVIMHTPVPAEEIMVDE